MITQKIDEFFDRYASRTNQALTTGTVDIDETVEAFSDYFVGSSPAGVMGGANDKKFRESISQGIDFYKKVGVTAMNIREKEIQILDEYHALVRVDWSCLYATVKAQGEIPFSVYYLVRGENGSVKIFSYITGDENKAFKEHGLL